MKVLTYRGFIFSCFILLSLSYSSFARTDTDMQSLNLLIEQVQDKKAQLVIFKRCAAVYLTSSSTAKVRPDTAEFEKKLKGVAKFFIFLSTELGKSDEVNQDSNQIEQDIDNLYSYYLADIEKNKNPDGSFADGLMQDDLPICSSIYEASKTL